MALRKFTRTEGDIRVLSPEAHKAVEDELHKLGKTSARSLSDSQRESISDRVDKSDRRS